MTATNFLSGRVVLHSGDSRDLIRSIPDASIDACVCDPPYALVSIVKRFGGKNAAAAKSEGATGVYKRASAGFMGKQWDTGEVAFDPAFWSEVLRVLKPGGHVVAFGGTRSYHRLGCAIEDAGFEIRDQLAWAYGSGFPKSHDVSKGIDKRRLEDVEPIRAVCRFVRAAMDARGLKSRHLVDHFGGCNARLIDHWAARDTDSQPSLPTPEQWETLKAVLGLSDDMDAEVARLNARKGEVGDTWKTAEIVGEYESATPGFVGQRFSARDNAIRAASDIAREWQGWGTALKPAWEPICLARKPLIGTVAENVLQHGTGALNIDGCRIEGRPRDFWNATERHGGQMAGGGSNSGSRGYVPGNPDGRWPANIVHDGSDEVLACFPEAPGQQGDLVGHSRDRKSKGIYGDLPAARDRGDAGSAARFFYTAKADADDRIGSKHPTVKPVDLMQWLCRLVTPPGGTILDPFAGTGTTGEAAFREGFRAVLIEREPEYQADIARRMALVLAGPDEKRRETLKAAGKVEMDAGPLFAAGGAA